MTTSPATAVLGFRPHTYFTAAVAVGGDAAGPRVLARRRIVFAEGMQRFVYHQAAELPRGEARALIDRVRHETVESAARQVSDLVRELRDAGVEVEVAVVPAGRAAAPLDLDEALRTHARMHAAEGAFYRDVVASACARAGLEVHGAPERELASRAAVRAGVAEEALQDRLKAMGATLGPPWSEDYRLATLAAWTRV